MCASFGSTPSWEELKRKRNDAGNVFIFTKAATVWFWGEQRKIKDLFADNLVSISKVEIPLSVNNGANKHVKGFLEEAICIAMSKNKPLLTRSSRKGSVLIVDSHTSMAGDLQPLEQVVGKVHGDIPGVFSSETGERLSWAESLKVSLEQKNNTYWVLLEPDI